jgi:LysM repeat protein
VAKLATRRLCPYLTIDGGGWRSAVAEREHRCGAVTPMALLTLDKQRRLCLTDRHLSCATFLAARGLDATTSDGPERPIVAVGPGRLAAAVAGQEAVTRWSIVRTTPVILDHSRIPVVAQLPRGRAAGQLGLAILLVAAFAALAVGRLGGPSTPGLVGAGSSSRPTPSAAIVGAASPTATPEPTGTPAPTPTKTPKPTKSPPPSATPRPSPSSTAVATTYKVKSGDTLYGISIRFHTSVKAIQELNNLTGTTLHIGQVLKIP